eukprot:COSAG02_NODE_49580_length_326_cov_0.585903_1_plen_52_part_10
MLEEHTEALTTEFLANRPLTYVLRSSTLDTARFHSMPSIQIFLRRCIYNSIL